MRQNPMNNMNNPNLPLQMQMNMRNKMLPFVPPHLKIGPNAMVPNNFNPMNKSNNPINSPMNINMNINMNMNFPNQNQQNFSNPNMHPNMMNMKPYGNKPPMNMYNQMNQNFNNNNNNDRKHANFGHHNSQGKNKNKILNY